MANAKITGGQALLLISDVECPFCSKQFTAKSEYKNLKQTSVTHLIFGQQCSSCKRFFDVGFKL